jgi:hypothetical protein
MQGLMLHCGAQYVDRAALDNVATPEHTDSWKPIGHADFVNLIEDRLAEAGFTIVDQAFGLGKNELFGMFGVRSKHRFSDFETVVGFVNSLAKRIARKMALGGRVFVCDNLCFSGEVQIRRKNTKYVDNDFVPMIDEAIAKIVDAEALQGERYEAYKSVTFNATEADHIIVEMLRRDIVNPQRISKVVEQWDAPDHEEFARTGNSAWRMFNAATEALKGGGIIALPERTTRLHGLIDEIAEFDALAVA